MAHAAPSTMSFDLVLFGGTGDLTWRKLMPALFQAFRHGKLPPDGRILAVARDDPQRCRLPRVHPRPLCRGRSRQATHRGRVRALRRAAALPPHGPVAAGDYAGAEGLARRAQHRHRGDVPRHRAAPVPAGVRAARRRGPERAARARGAGKAARPRPRQRTGDQRVVRRRVQRTAGPAHRPLPGQAVGAEPVGAALRQCAVRAVVAAREHLQHPDHAGRGAGRRHARRLLRPHRRAARHGPEPRAAAADDDRDGAAADQRRRRHPRRKAQGAEVAEAVHTRNRGARRGARPVQGRHGQRPAGAGLPRGEESARRAARPRPSSRCAPRCRTGAGPACRSSCARASGWRHSMRRSSSTSGRCRTRSSRAARAPTSW